MTYHLLFRNFAVRLVLDRRRWVNSSGVRITDSDPPQFIEIRVIGIVMTWNYVTL